MLLHPAYTQKFCTESHTSDLPSMSIQPQDTGRNLPHPPTRCTATARLCTGFIQHTATTCCTRCNRTLYIYRTGACSPNNIANTGARKSHAPNKHTIFHFQFPFAFVKQKPPRNWRSGIEKSYLGMTPRLLWFPTVV